MLLRGADLRRIREDALEKLNRYNIWRKEIIDPRHRSERERRLQSIRRYLKCAA